MDIHVVKSGDSIYSIAQQYSVSPVKLVEDNGIANPNLLAVGQALLILYPKVTYTVKTGDTLYKISVQNKVNIIDIWRLNPALGGRDKLFVGQKLTLEQDENPRYDLRVNSYAYPSIDRSLLYSTLPYLSELTPFTYRVTADGSLVSMQDDELISSAKYYRVTPVMHVAGITATGAFDSDIASSVLNNKTSAQRLISEILKVMKEKGYGAIDVDFEYVYAEDAKKYAEFIADLKSKIPKGYYVTVALVAKSSGDQKGLLYEGHDYKLMGQAADYVLLMTYEWGYAMGPPMAVAPINYVENVVDYALGVIPKQKIYMGIPNYGYDWQIPFKEGNKARSITNEEAIKQAIAFGAQIMYDETSKTPYYNYTDQGGKKHEVWFEDARSIKAKLELLMKKDLIGAGYWNLDRPFTANWCLLNAMVNIYS